MPAKDPTSGGGIPGNAYKTNGNGPNDNSKIMEMPARDPTEGRSSSKAYKNQWRIAKGVYNH